MTDALTCWRCGHDLGDLPLPLSRRAECPACDADLHVCVMCEFYDTRVAKSCRETIAEEVKDKRRANFCDYFRARAGVAASHGDAAAAGARDALNALFDLDDGKSSGDSAQSSMDRKRAEADEAKRKLDDLFGLDSKD